MNTKDIAIAWFERVWNQKDATAIQDLMHPEAVAHTEGGVVSGPAGFMEALHSPLMSAFPDIRVELRGVIAEGDDAVVRWVVTATNSGKLLGIEATGKRLQFEGMTWLRIQDGKVIEGWDRWNLHALLGTLQGGAESCTAKFV